jgi:hypothetical protein
MTLQTYVVDVERIALRDVAGEGCQLELVIKTQGGDVVLRCIGRRDRVVRVLDLRHRDRKKRRRERYVSVPVNDVKP